LKVPFTLELAQKYFLANHERITSPTADTFDDTRDFMVIVIAIYQLCRLSEITNTSPPSQANAFPIFIGDLKFYNSANKQLLRPVTATDKWWDSVAYIKCRYPPSKADPFSFNIDLLFPRPVKHAKYVSAFSTISLFLSLYPVDSAYNELVPLCRRSRKMPSAQVTDSKFWAGFKKGCRRAAIMYNVFGKHAFRVAGMNRLQELKAGPVVISAHGHWASDAWADYSRRNAFQLMNWITKMSGAIAARY
jgi:hypothetical protein